MDNISKLLKKLTIKDTGIYKNHFYIIELEDSNAYARMYTILDKYAVNTEYPAFTKTDSGTTTNIVTYFEATADDKEYELFLMADFKEDRYKLKIKEKEPLL